MTDHPAFSNDPPGHNDNYEEDEEEELSEAEEEEDVEGEEEEEEDDEESLVSESWISNFCSVIGHEYFAEVTEEFIEDDFNLTGLSAIVPMYKEALEMILDVEPDGASDEASEGDPESDAYNNGAARKNAARMGAGGAGNIALIESSAELLYGLVHQRYILSRPGMQQMYEKYIAAHFGHCPRVFCNNARVLPCGSTDTPNMDTVKLFCPCCLDIYTPPNSRFQQVDGAFFGTSFASLFLMTFTDIDYSAPSHKTPAQIPPTARKASSSSTAAAASSNSAAASSGLPQQPSTLNGFATQNIAPGLGAGKLYDMKIYGFKVSERSKSGPRMKWLRTRPDDMNQLDEMTRAEMRRTGKLRRKKKAQSSVKDEDGMDVSPSPQESLEQRRVIKKPVRRLRADEPGGAPSAR
ncbi:hypothetical protein ABW21_db0201830 [Orbilia brochopaga]|nr:hypothetical protein ABW21_db0201830 [Drechslerella brochopaga]